MPVLNDPRVGRALDSLIEQSKSTDVQIIVVDGMSDEPTMREISSRRQNIDVLIREPDSGIYNAMNKGIRAATNDVIGILNSDDRYVHPTVLRDVSAVLGDPNIDACYSDLIYRNEHGLITRTWIAGKNSRINWHLGWMPPHPTFFVKKTVYDMYGLFQENYSIAADYELMLRLHLRHNIRSTYIREVLVEMSPGGHSNRNAAAIIQNNLESYRAWKSNNLKWGILVPLLKPIRKILQFRYFRLVPQLFMKGARKWPK